MVYVSLRKAAIISLNIIIQLIIVMEKDCVFVVVDTDCLNSILYELRLQRVNEELVSM